MDKSEVFGYVTDILISNKKERQRVLESNLKSCAFTMPNVIVNKIIEVEIECIKAEIENLIILKRGV